MSPFLSFEELAFDPDTGTPKWSEALSALRLENQEGIQLVRAKGGISADYVDASDPTSLYDIAGGQSQNMKQSSLYDIQGLITAVTRKLSKPGSTTKVAVDLNGFSSQEKSTILGSLSSLDQTRVVIIDGEL